MHHQALAGQTKCRKTVRATFLLGLTVALTTWCAAVSDEGVSYDVVENMGIRKSSEMLPHYMPRPEIPVSTLLVTFGRLGSKIWSARVASVKEILKHICKATEMHREGQARWS